MDLTTANQLFSNIGLPGGIALLVAAGATIILNLFVYLIQRQFDFDRDKKIAELQTRLDSTLRQLQTNLDVKNHVSRAKFDVEFMVYRDLWRKLIVYRNSVGRYMITLKNVKAAPEYPDELKSDLIDVLKNSSDYTQFIDDNSPFFAITVQDELSRLYDHDRVLTNTIDFMGKGATVDYQKSYAETQKMVSLILKVSTSIRERLENIVVVA